MANSKPLLLAIGGAHIDRRGKTATAFVGGASNPGTMKEDVGGGVFNALRVACRRGAEGTLFSVRGGDGGGAAVEAAVEAAGITDISGVFLDRATASYTALLDHSGDVVGALADMSIYEATFPRRMRLSSLRGALGRADAVLVDANPPAPALERLVRLAGALPAYAVAISPAKVVRFAPLLDSLACLFCNTREAGALAEEASGPADQVRLLRGLGLRSAVVTDGARPAVFFDETGAYALAPPTLEAVADATGAGDALAGAAVAARLAGLPLTEAVRHGMAAATLALQSARSAPEFSEGAFEAALATVGEAQPIELG